TEVQRIDDLYTPTGLTQTEEPKLGDHLMQVGPRAIASWSDLLHVLASLDELDVFPREQVSSNATLQDLDRISEAGSHVVQRGEQELVRVRLERRQGEQVREFSCWRAVGPPPWQETAHSLLWFSVKITLLIVAGVVFWKRPNDEPTLRFFILCIVT